MVEITNPRTTINQIFLHNTTSTTGGQDFNQAPTTEDSLEPTFDPTRTGVFSDIPQATISLTTSTTKAPATAISQEECGIMPQGSGLVQGGLKTADGQFPWAAAVFRRNSLFGNIVDYSVGSLISFRHVYIEALTISFINERQTVLLLPKPNEIRVFFGFDDLSLVTEKSPFSEVSDIIVHPKYILGLPMQANIAVLILASPVEFSKTVFPICLWNTPTKVEDVVGRNVFGFGYGGQSVASTTRFKKFIVAKIKDQNECPADYKFILRNVKDRSNYFCAGGDRNETICVGDSAAIYAKKNNLWYLFGTVAYHDISIRTRVCNANKAAMFEFIGPYIKWIQNIVITM
jgi:Trypsin